VFERAASFLIVLVLLAGCARREAPDVVLVTFDTTRYDHFGCTGDPEAHTPIVDGLAARGLVFELAVLYAGAPTASSVVCSSRSLSTPARFKNTLAAIRG